MIGTLEIRPEHLDDFPAIHALVRDAFGREFEAIVVERLRATPEYEPGLALVALVDGAVVGHIMITKQAIDAESGQLVHTTILAPFAVAPQFQGQGVGQSLTRAALELTLDAGYGSMILVGHPWYYPRFGFRPASTWGIRYASPIPDEVFMAIELMPGALASAAGTVTLSAAFDEV